MPLEHRIVGRSLRELDPFADNPRRHSRRQLRKLARIIRLGFIDEQGRILAGHDRCEAALMAGIEEAECFVVEHLTEAQKRALVL